MTQSWLRNVSKTQEEHAIGTTIRSYSQQWLCDIINASSDLITTGFLNVFTQEHFTG